MRAAALVVRFEALCDAPAETLRAVFRHGALPDAEPIVARHAAAVRFPTYYESNIADAALAVIREETAATAGLWGY